MKHVWIPLAWAALFTAPCPAQDDAVVPKERVLKLLNDLAAQVAARRTSEDAKYARENVHKTVSAALELHKVEWAKRYLDVAPDRIYLDWHDVNRFYGNHEAVLQEAIRAVESGSGVRASRLEEFRKGVERYRRVEARFSGLFGDYVNALGYAFRQWDKEHEGKSSLTREAEDLRRRPLQRHA